MRLQILDIYRTLRICLGRMEIVVSCCKQTGKLVPDKLGVTGSSHRGLLGRGLCAGDLPTRWIDQITRAKEGSRTQLCAKGAGRQLCYVCVCVCQKPDVHVTIRL